MKEIGARTRARVEQKKDFPFAPPLNMGDRLSRAEFERRYEAHSEIKKAELVEGVMYMPSPVHFEKHSRIHAEIITWLGMYAAATAGVSVADNATVRLDLENEVQPDALLRLDESRAGHSHITEDDYIQGPPELIVEIAASSAAYDLHDKKRVYQRSGVQEYLAIQMYEKRADWFVLREGIYQTLTSDKVGVVRSEVFPGLWLKAEALFKSDPAAGSGPVLAELLAVLQGGLASPEHAAFVGKPDPSSTPS